MVVKRQTCTLEFSGRSVLLTVIAEIRGKGKGIYSHSTEKPVKANVKYEW
jgi:hypothetical protein